MRPVKVVGIAGTNLRQWLRQGLAAGTVLGRWMAAGVVALLISSPALAQGPPILTDTAFTTGLEGKTVRVFSKTTFRGGTSQTEIPIMVPYDLGPDTVVGAAVPWVFAGTGAGSAPGFGDIALFGKHVALRTDGPNRTFRLAPFIKVKLATSNSLGTGSTDVDGGTIMTWGENRWSLNADLAYQWKGTGRNGRAGNGVAYNMALGYRWAPERYRIYPTAQINAYLELNGFWQDRSTTLPGTTDPNSGGHFLFLSPGLQWIPRYDLVLEAAWQMPILQNPNGVQPLFSGAVLAGIRYLFF